MTIKEWENYFKGFGAQELGKFIQALETVVQYPTIHDQFKGIGSLLLIAKAILESKVVKDLG
jgi:hypothetical protein